MKQKRVFRLSLILILLLFLVMVKVETQTIMGVNMLNDGEADELTVTQSWPENQPLTWNDRPLFRDDTTGIWYLPVEREGSWKGLLKTQKSGFRLYGRESQWHDRQACLRAGEPLDLYLSSGRECYAAQVCLCGGPVLSLEEEKAGDEISRGVMRFWDPREVQAGIPAEEQPAAYLEQPVRWHRRGNNSAGAEKSSYRVSLLDEQGEESAQDLLGLGRDADWVMNSLYSDGSLAREKTAYALWNRLHENNPADLSTARIEYVEVLVNGRYQGVYGLCRPVDKAWLELKDGDILYKWRTPALPWSGGALNSFDHDRKLNWGDTVSIQWPREWREGLWKPLSDFSDCFLIRSGSWQYKDALRLTDLENLLDISLYRQFLGCRDNSHHNLLYVWQADTEKLLRLPWDVDRCLNSDVAPARTDDPVREVIRDRECSALSEIDPAQTAILMRDRWAELRQNLFDPQAVGDELIANAEQLRAGGAWTRNWERWPEPEFTTGPEEAAEFLRERTVWTDELFGYAD